MSKVITLSLNSSSINKAIREIQTYESEIETNLATLRQNIAQKLKTEMEAIIAKSKVSENTKGYSKTPNAGVTIINESGSTSTVVAVVGEDVYWIEFGAGVHFNSDGAPNDYRTVAGAVGIGQYGSGHGTQDKWVYSENGRWYWTYGTKATKPVYNSVKSVSQQFEELARKVFSS